MSSEKRAGRLYLLNLGLAGAALALLAAAGALVIGGAHFGTLSAQAITAACDRWLSAGGPAALAGVSVIALAALAIALGVRSISRQTRASRRFLRGLRLVDESAELRGSGVRVFDSARPQAFCAGFLRPRIYLSRGALEVLSAEELEAVLAHERHHLRRRDPLRLLLARGLAAGLFFMPLLRRMSERYEALGELAADEAAVRSAPGRRPLAAALLKFSDPEPVPAPVVAIAPERVDHLMGDPDASRWRLPPTLAGRSALALALLSALVLLSAQVELSPQMPLLVAAGCMAFMFGAPAAVAAIAIGASLRFVRARRA